jgi:basic membrane lipoprotein Med (substrate-binding protein (PBP1-ABC) superfamily)
MAKANVSILVAVAIFIVLASVVVWIIVGGDKPRPEAKILYLGPSKITESTDKEYSTALSRAKALEKSGNLVEAITQYELASKINRFVMPSYYPLLDVARVKCKQGDKLYAINTLRTFLSYAEDEVNPTSKSRFIIENNTKKQIDDTKRQIIAAQELLKDCAGN